MALLSRLEQSGFTIMNPTDFVPSEHTVIELALGVNLLNEYFKDILKLLLYRPEKSKEMIIVAPYRSVSHHPQSKWNTAANMFYRTAPRTNHEAEGGV